MITIDTVQTVYGALKYLYDACQKTRENAEECKRLCAHVETMMKLIEEKCGDNVSERLGQKLQKLAGCVLFLGGCIVAQY